MTLPKLLFALNQKHVVLSKGKGNRVRANPRSEVSPALKAAIQDHKPALLELLSSGDIDGWRMIRLDKPQADDPPEGDGMLLPEDDPYEFDPDLAERWSIEDAELDEREDADAVP